MRKLTAEVEGKELDIAFNAKYLTDVLKKYRGGGSAAGF